MDRVVITASEVAGVKENPETPRKTEAALPPPIPWYFRVLLALFVGLLPVLCLITVILRVALRGQPGRIKHAWTAYLSTLLVISGFLNFAAGVLIFSLVPVPAIVNTGLPVLDERTEFPGLPSTSTMSGQDISQKLKPNVVIISPAFKYRFTKGEFPSASFGAGELLMANEGGYLFATARHVVDHAGMLGKNGGRAMIAGNDGVWSGADVIARNRHLDLALLWVPRQSGSGTFVQPIAEAQDGGSVFVIGHPQGLRFTLSTGIVSRIQGATVQISAPVSPGDSGGPVYDQNGNLVGIISSTMDKNIDPNAENLNFAVNSKTLLELSSWEFDHNGRALLEQFINAVKSKPGDAAPEKKE